jgi:hypothetical protein
MFAILKSDMGTDLQCATGNPLRLCFGELRPSACLRLGLGDPRVSQASPKGDPSVTQGTPKGRIEISALFAAKEWNKPGRVGNRVVAPPAAISEMRLERKILSRIHRAFIRTDRTGDRSEEKQSLTEQDSKSRVNGKCNRNQQSYLPVVWKAGY